MNNLQFLNELSPFDRMSESTLHETFRTFYLKDIYTTGLKAVRREAQSAIQWPSDSMEVMGGYTLLDDAEDEESGRPIRDYYLWTAIARLMITAGDLATAAVEVEHRWPEGAPLTQGGAWRFSYRFRTMENGAAAHYIHPFLTLFPVSPDTTLADFEACMRSVKADDADAKDVAYKAMGSIDKTQLFSKLGAYPLAVHPKLGQRSIAVQLPYLLADTLIDDTGLQLLQHWQPEDTSEHPGVYYFSDGVDPYVMVYHAPALRDCLIRIDAAVGRTEADGAITADATPQFMVPDPEPESITPPIVPAYDAERDWQDDPLDDADCEDELPD